MGKLNLFCLFLPLRPFVERPFIRTLGRTAAVVWCGCVTGMALGGALHTVRDLPGSVSLYLAMVTFVADDDEGTIVVCSWAVRGDECEACLLIG